MNENIDVRDDIAHATGWIYAEWAYGNFGVQKGWGRYREAEGVRVLDFQWDDHPIPNTLDEAAKLPEGWWYWVNYCGTTEGSSVDTPLIEHVVCEAVHKATVARVRSEAPTELEARFALRLAVLKHVAALAAKETK